VDEEYEFEAPVTKTRIVTQPYTALEEREVEQKVVLQSTKTVWVPAYRIDEVEGLKIIEVEEFQEYQEVEHVVGDRIIGGDIRTLDIIQKEGRFYGNKFYPSFAPELEGLKLDDIKEKSEPVSLEVENCDYLDCFEGNTNVEEPKLVLTELDLPNEMFKVTNISNEYVSLDGWTVKDENAHERDEHQRGGSRNTFEFSRHCPGRKLAPGASISVYCGKDSDKKFDYSKERDKAHWFNANVWNDEGDKAYLFDPDRNLVHSLNVTDAFKISTRYTQMTSDDGSSSPRHVVKIDMDDFPNSLLASPRAKGRVTPTPTKKSKGGRT
jgi:hypothetical protein